MSGIIINPYVYAATGFLNTKSLAFDGVDDSVNCGASTLSGETALSISAWIYPTAYGSATAESFVSTDAASPRAFYLGLFNGTNFRFSLSTNGTVLTSLATAASTVTLNTWQHILVTWDQVNLKLYKDGVLLKTVATTYASNGTFTTTNDLVIGARRSPSTGAFPGKIDEVGIWNVALGLTEITELYNSGTPIALNTDTGNYTSASDLQAWYRMGDNSTYKSPQILMPENTNKDKVSNWSFELDGVDDTIDIGTTSLGITTAISVSAWVKIPVTDTGGGGTNIRMITCEDVAGGADRNWLLYWRGTGYNYFMAGIFHTDGSSTTINSTGITPNDGNWHHVMLTFDGTTDANGLKLYVDGTLFQATAGSTGTRSTASVEPAIGSLTAGGGRFFQGNIDEVSVFDAVKVEADVSDGTEPIDVSGDSDLVAYWKLGEEATFSTNWTVPDSSTNSNTGTSANMTVEDRVGEASNSESNAVSNNMDAVDIESNVP